MSENIREIPEKLQQEKILHHIALGVSAKIGEAFFLSLVQYLSQALEVDFAFVGEIVKPEGVSIRTIAGYGDGRVIENFEYQLEDTPCENFLKKSVSVYPQGIQQMFPKDIFLINLNVESYIGISLFDSVGQPQGLICVLSRRSLQQESIRLMEEVLKIFAVRASSELERQQAEKKIAFQASLLDQVRNAVIATDLEGYITYWNKFAQQLYQLTPENMGALIDYVIFSQEGQEIDEVTQLTQYNSPLEKKSQWEGDYWEVEFTAKRGDGSTFPAYVVNALIKDGIGNPCGVVGVSMDISDRLSSSTILRQYERIVSATPDGISLVDSNYIYRLVNQTYLNWNNRQWEEIVGHSIEELFGQETFEHIIKHCIDRCLAGETLQYEAWFDFQDGISRFVSVTYAPYVELNGLISGVVVSTRDLTDLKKTEEAFKEREQFLRSIYEGVEYSVFTIDVSEDGNFRYLGLNPAHERLTGIKNEQLQGKSPDDVLLPTWAVKAKQHYLDCINASATICYEEYQPFQDQDMWWITTLTPLRDTGGRIYQIIGTSIDITQRKKAEAALKKLNQELEQRVQKRTQQLERSQTILRQREQTFRTLAENAPDIIVRFDHALRYIYISPAIEKATGLSPQAIIGKTNQELGIPSDLALSWNQILQNVFKTGKATEVQLTLPRSDSTKYYQARIVPELNNSGRITSLLSISRDITQLKEAEEQLRTSLREKNVLLKEIHHRVKNNMQLISSVLNLQANSIHDPKILEPFQESQRRIQVMALIHEQLYRSNNLAKINFPKYVQYLANSLFNSYICDNYCISLKTDIKAIELAIDIAIPCGLIINELVSNAIKYAFSNSTQHPEIGIKFFLNSDNQYVLIVWDNGVGIPEHINIYKTDSLGLQVVLDLTDQLDGKLILNKTGGTAFEISFPSGL
jgi:hypothetical protein